MYQQPNYNYTQPAATTVASSVISPSTNTFDFERLLQQNLTDGSTTTPLRSTFLPNIDEDEDSGAEQLDASQMNCMNMSVRGSMNKKEGPMEGSRHGLLYSLCNIPANEQVFTPEFTTADMCLSTLYLHELHHKQVSVYLNFKYYLKFIIVNYLKMRRRGRRLEQSQRHLWQNPHHHAQPSTSSLEKTPLLAKKT